MWTQQTMKEVSGKTSNDENLQPSHNKNEKKVTVVFVVCVVTIVIIGALVKISERYAIKKDYRKSIGYIIKYFDSKMSDLSKGRTITYAYKVNGRSYTRKTSTSVKFPECDNRDGLIEGDCGSKRFWVIYSVDDPSSSLINLKIEFNKDSIPAFPSSLEDFY